MVKDIHIVKNEEICKLKDEIAILNANLEATKNDSLLRKRETEERKNYIKELENENQRLEKVEVELMSRFFNLEKENEKLNSRFLQEKENKITLESSRNEIQSILKSLQHEHEIQTTNMAQLSKQRDSLMVSKKDLEEELHKFKEGQEADRRAFNDIIGNQFLAYDTLKS
uniref:Uncharacterized protein n=1 Tax=Aplanochytrium stocchinoi TaxID=215587 RepID=A0A7S3PPB6_9STRA